MQSGTLFLACFFVMLISYETMAAPSLRRGGRASGGKFAKHQLTNPKRQEYIVSGTKWCGAGNSSVDYDDLGPRDQVDRCCRKHDHCPYNFMKGETKDHHTNNGLFTESSCNCDEEFFDCLKSVSGWQILKAKVVGEIYFGIGRSYCLKKETGRYCVNPEYELSDECPKWATGMAAIPYDYMNDAWKFHGSVKEIHEAHGGNPAPAQPQPSFFHLGNLNSEF